MLRIQWHNLLRVCCLTTVARRADEPVEPVDLQLPGVGRRGAVREAHALSLGDS